MSTIEQVPAQDWEAWVAAHNGTVLDVREPQELEQGTLPGALLVRMGEIPDRLQDLPEEGGILVVCRSGARSDRVATFLSMNGFTEVANMAGGMKALGLQA
jgi:rhodanese-related sulfurtransferase